MKDNMKNLKEKEERFQAVLLGAVIGDALGNPVENMSAEFIAYKYGILKDYAANWDLPGTYTDDTELTLAIAESLLEIEAFSLDDIALRFKRWVAVSDSWGMASQSACINLVEGKSPKESGIKSAGNGPATRVSSLGLLYSYSEDKELLHTCTVSSTKITHTDERAIAGAIAVSCAVAYLLNNHKTFRVDTFLKAVLKEVRQYSKELATAIANVKHLLNKEDTTAIQKIGTGGYVLESVPFAFYCFLKSPIDFESSLIRAVNAGGDTDSNASITAVLSGAFNGMNAIPDRWISELRNHEKGRDHILDLGKKLFELYTFNLP